jgi:hypothetical protein
MTASKQNRSSSRTLDELGGAKRCCKFPPAGTGFRQLFGWSTLVSAFTAHRGVVNSLFSTCRKDKVSGGDFAACDRYFLTLCSQRFMPGSDGVFSCRQIGQAEHPILSRHGKVPRLQDHEISLHPRMDIAFHRNDLFFFIGVILSQLSQYKVIYYCDKSR